MFDRCVVINLLRRPDRWRRFSENLARVRWPFGAPCRRVAGLDGNLLARPPFWKLSNGAWANLMTHLHVLDQAVADGVQSLLILEDDALLPDDLDRRVEPFMKAVPDDWEQLYFGGKHFYGNGDYPLRVNDEVLQGRAVNGAWAYAVRGRALKILQAVCQDRETLMEPTPFSDAIWGTLHSQRLIRAYTPTRWCIGHAGGLSDVFGNDREDEWYDLPDDVLSHLEAA